MGERWQILTCTDPLQSWQTPLVT